MRCPSTIYNSDQQKRIDSLTRNLQAKQPKKGYKKLKQYLDNH